MFASDSTVKIHVATDAKSGHRAYVSRKPDVTVIDIKLPDVSGFELMRRIRKENPDAKIIMFSMNDDPALVVRAIGRPDLLRRVEVDAEVQELPGAEIGRLLGVSESRVSQILAGIRRKLKDQLTAYDVGPIAV